MNSEVMPVSTPPFVLHTDDLTFCKEDDQVTPVPPMRVPTHGFKSPVDTPETIAHNERIRLKGALQSLVEQQLRQQGLQPGTRVYRRLFKKHAGFDYPPDVRLGKFRGKHNAVRAGMGLKRPLK